MQSLEQAPGAPTSPLGDEEIVPLVLKGQTALFEVLIRRNNQRLYRAIRSVVHDEAVAEDAMQQTYVLAFQRLSQFAAGAAFSTWLLRIGLNEGLQYLRRTRKWQPLELADDSQGERVPDSSNATPEARAYARQTVELLEEIMDRLPATYRLALVLREIEGLSASETAAAMGISEDNVKQRVFRGRELIRDQIEARTGEALREVFSFEATRCDRVVAGVFAQLGQ